MELELVNGGLDACLFEELVQLMGREIRDSNVSDFTGGQEHFHAEPGLQRSASAGIVNWNSGKVCNRHERSQCNPSHQTKLQANASSRDRGIPVPNRSASYRGLAEPGPSDGCNGTMRQLHYAMRGHTLGEGRDTDHSRALM